MSPETWLEFASQLFEEHSFGREGADHLREVLADRDRLAAELVKSGPSCDRCQSAHCCSVAGSTVPPLCVTDPEGSLPLWMPWTNEDVRKRVDAVYAQVDRLQAELARVRSAGLRLLAAVDDYHQYEHDGDPWTEDARVMMEMDIDDLRASRNGPIEEIRAALAQPQDGTTEGRG